MKLNRRGLIATIVYHALLILLLVFAGLTFPDPPPEEEGILVNFGTDDSGFGAYEPKGDDQQAGDPELPVLEETEAITEEVAESIPEPVYTPPDPTPVDNTQDVEEVKVKEDPKPTPEEIQREREEQERIQREREEQQRIEKERIEQERIEREKREEEERRERERQAQAERLNNLGKNAFGNQGVGKTDGAQGVTEGTGNQGDINGSPDADRYGTGGGLGNNIDSYGLGSRKAKGKWPLPNMSGCDVTQRIEITMEIKVDRDGNVLSATFLRGTFQDKCITDMVTEAALKSKFTADQAAAYRQTGWIKYIIVP
ncbi:MAG: hypothetical protein GY790_14840 [Bacteroidetes bacterium]|nr:hypothetical protein [Bacteroidota bacterium]